MTKKRVSSFRGKVVRNAEKQKRDSSFSYLVLPKDLEIFNPEKGRIKFDILPYIVKDENHPDRDDEYNIAIPDSEWYRRPFSIHRNIGPDNEAIVCPGSIGEKCPICEYRMKLTDEDDEDEAKALKGDWKKRVIYLVFPIDSKKWDEDVYLYDSSQYVFQKALNDELEDNPDNEIFADAFEGKTLNVRYTKESTGKYSYANPSRIDFIDRAEPYDEEFLDSLPNLDDILKDSIMPYKELEKKFLAYVDDDDEDDEMEDVPDEEDDEPRGRSRKPRRGSSRNTKKVEDDEDEEEDEPEEDEKEDEPEEEVEEKPRSRARKPVSRKTSTTKTRGKCPYGHKFGVDTDDFDDCADCKVWDDCNEANPDT
jgi:hypothetical protein